MPRRLLVRLRRRLEASSLRMSDPVRLELERELLELMTPTIAGDDALTGAAVIVVRTSRSATCRRP